MSPGVTAEDGGATLLGKQVSDLQSGVTVGNGAITGTLYKNEGWSSGYLKGPGYYLALKFTSSNWSQYDSVKVGLDPSAQSGIIEILNDPDKNGVFKVKQNLSQKFVVEYRKGDAVERDVYDLSGLTLSEEPPAPVVTPSAIADISSSDSVAFSGYNDSGLMQTRTITQNITTFEDNSTENPGIYTGTIAGEIVSSLSSSNPSIPPALGFKVNGDTYDAIAANPPEGAPEITQLRYKLYWNEADASDQSVGTGHQLGGAAGNPAEEANRIGFGKTSATFIDINEGATQLELTVKYQFIDMSTVPPTVYGTDKFYTVNYDISNLTLPATT